MSDDKKPKLRSKDWFDNPDKPDMTALYLERYLNYGLTREELQSGKPIIGIAQTGSDLSPCNRPHLELAKRVRDGIRDAGGIVFEFPVHPIQETGKRPTASLDRNLAYLGLVEILYGYPFDGVVLTVGCDKTTPACLMAAATVDLPAIVLSGGPMLNGYEGGTRCGSGTVIWDNREKLASGEIDYEEFIRRAVESAPSAGYCNTMGTASTMNALSEVLGMQLPGGGSIPALYRERGQLAYETGRRIVDLVRQDIRPSQIMTRKAFENAIIANSALGGSTNAPIHLTAIARHMGVELTIGDWEELGLDIPLLVNLQPAGKYLAEDFHRAGGVRAVMAELIRQGRIHGDCPTVSGASIAENCREAVSENDDVIRSFDTALLDQAGFKVLGGNLFDAAIMKLSVITQDFRARYLSDPASPNAFEATVYVFDGPEDYHARIDDPALAMGEDSLLIMRGAGPIGYPGAAEVVNMRPPTYLLEKGIRHLPCVGDGRQSGTSASPSILNASPEAALGGGLAIVRDGDRVRIDLNQGRADILISDEEFETRRQALAQSGGYDYPESQTPWQELQRQMVDQLSEGMVLKNAVKYQRIAAKSLPRDNH